MALPSRPQRDFAKKEETQHAPSRHQSEPMQVAEPVMSRIAAVGIDTQAMKSSAAVMAMKSAAAVSSTDSSDRQADAVLGVLNKLPVKREDSPERRQLNELTKLLSSLNTIAKRDDDDLVKRQLGLIKSVPEALAQTAQVEKLVAGLPIKRDVEDKKAHHTTYTEQAWNGVKGWFEHKVNKGEQETPEMPSAAESIGLGDSVKGSGPLDPASGVFTGIVAKREAKQTEALDESYADCALEGAHAWADHKPKHNQKAPEISSASDALKLGESVKRNSATDPVGGLLSGLLGGLAKRELGESLATSEDVADALDTLAKRNGLDSIDELIKSLTKGGQLNNGLNVRQLDVLSSLATGTLSNAGSVASQLGKVTTGNVRRSDAGEGAIVGASMAGMKSTKSDDNNDDGYGEDLKEVATDLAEAGEELQNVPQSSSPALLHKRQVPPIAGSDALSIVKGLVANPSTALAPVTKGILLGGTPLGDLAPN